MKIEVVVIHRDPVGTELILAEIRQIGRTLVTQLQDALAKLKAEDDVLAADVDKLLAALAQEPANVADAVKQALAAAGADDATNAAAVDAATAATQSVVDKITSALQPPPPPPPEPLALTTTSLPDATVGQSYTGSLAAAGGVAPLSFQSSPPGDNGLTIGADGSVSGTPAAPGSSTFSVTVTDSAGASASGTVTLNTVAAAA